MNKEELIQDCARILKGTQNKKLQRMFRKQSPMNQDIVIEKITKDSINSFTNKMLSKFERYIEK
jgi:hypothetical protein